MRLCWARPAVGHLSEIRAYIRQDSPRAAAQVVKTIREQVATLKSHPLIGRPGIIEGTRELIISRLPHLVVYRVQQGAIEVLAVVHTARDWPFQL